MVYKINTGSVNNSAITTDLLNDDAVTADKLDNSFLNGVVPIGGIIMFSGLNAPDGYVFCDDSAAAVAAGAPDLRDKFIVGFTPSSGNTTYPTLALNATGGSANAVLLSHNHTASSSSSSVSTSSTTISPNPHNHGVTTNRGNVTEEGSGDLGGADRNETTGNRNLTATTSTSTSTTTTTTVDQFGLDAAGATTTTQTGTNANLPPYYALAFIMRIS